jgi:hypothetical protein
VIVAVLVVCGLIVLVVFLVMRRRSNSNSEDAAANDYVSLEPVTSNSSQGHLSNSVGIATSTSETHVPTKSWEINYSELKLLETVGEGAFGTVHRAIFRHQQVAVKKLKNQIDQKEVRKFKINVTLTYVAVEEL